MNLEHHDCLQVSLGISEAASCEGNVVHHDEDHNHKFVMFICNQCSGDSGAGGSKGDHSEGREIERTLKLL